jgi:DNA-binding transcriptional regulator YdaS (Cro superfamily)
MARNEIIDRVFEAAGSGRRLAKLLDVSPQAVSQWRSIPLRRAAEIERLTGIKLHELRPDVFDAPAGEGVE